MKYRLSSRVTILVCDSCTFLFEAKLLLPVHVVASRLSMLMLDATTSALR